MSLTVTNDMSLLKGKSLIGVNFNPGHEYVLTLEDKTDGEISRVRISADLKNLLDDYKAMR